MDRQWLQPYRVCLQVISFNLGSMGFLTNHDYNSMQEDLQEVIDGSETLEQCAIDGSVRDYTSLALTLLMLIVLLAMFAGICWLQCSAHSSIC